MRTARNCAGDPNHVPLGFFFDPELNQCPWSCIPDEAFAVVDEFRLWTSLGILPYSGSSMGEQPNFVVEGFAICAEVRRAMEIYRRSKERQEDQAVLVALAKGASR